MIATNDISYIKLAKEVSNALSNDEFIGKTKFLRFGLIKKTSLNEEEKILRKFNPNVDEFEVEADLSLFKVKNDSIYLISFSTLRIRLCLEHLKDLISKENDTETLQSLKNDETVYLNLLKIIKNKIGTDFETLDTKFHKFTILQKLNNGTSVHCPSCPMLVASTCSQCETCGLIAHSECSESEELMTKYCGYPLNLPIMSFLYKEFFNENSILNLELENLKIQEIEEYEEKNEKIRSLEKSQVKMDPNSYYAKTRKLSNNNSAESVSNSLVKSNSKDLVFEMKKSNSKDSLLLKSASKENLNAAAVSYSNSLQSLGKILPTTSEGANNMLITPSSIRKTKSLKPKLEEKPSNGDTSLQVKEALKLPSASTQSSPRISNSKVKNSNICSDIENIKKIQLEEDLNQKTKSENTAELVKSNSKVNLKLEPLNFIPSAAQQEEIEVFDDFEIQKHVLHRKLPPTNTTNISINNIPLLRDDDLEPNAKKILNQIKKLPILPIHNTAISNQGNTILVIFDSKNFQLVDEINSKKPQQIPSLNFSKTNLFNLIKGESSELLNAEERPRTAVVINQVRRKSVIPDIKKSIVT
ncbi:hypothetical protein HK099_002525 [Clydaea vesicula]|uniref:Phorbol-ester/DAG-type domain-containing protein n=1 Tax=Clydaea vesicula TaxID=447962 RepID=A0AAD5XWN8_9FUNG|nr:hypothetical protein HK099_002525 [Clydaea vesicula]